MKECQVCKVIKPRSKFTKDRSRPDNKCPFCKSCAYEKYRKWYLANSERAKLKTRTYNSTHKEKRQEYCKANSKRRAASILLWRKKNKQHVLEYKNAYEKNRRKFDVGFKLLHNLRGRLLQAIKANSKRSSTIKLLCCSIEELKRHLESKFSSGMTWENYGRLGWHMDHIIPCASFDFSIPGEQEKCFHFTNLQPLWCIDNIRKSNKIIHNP